MSSSGLNKRNKYNKVDFLHTDKLEDHADVSSDEVDNRQQNDNYMNTAANGVTIHCYHFSMHATQLHLQNVNLICDYIQADINAHTYIYTHSFTHLHAHADNLQNPIRGQNR